jgi:hypothetical protein
MKGKPACPRCGVAVRPPGLWSSAWECEEHGPVPPLQPVVRPSEDCLRHLQSLAVAPIWLPWPLPTGWLVTGYAHAGDERSGSVAIVVGCSGPAPLGGPGDLLVVAESPGVGLGAWLAGLAGPDPGDGFDAGPAHAKVHVAGHPTPLWSVDAGPELAAYVGEAKATWLWVLLWPATTGVLLVEDLGLRDLRSAPPIDIPYGALMPRLARLTVPGDDSR